MSTKPFRKEIMKIGTEYVIKLEESLLQAIDCNVGDHVFITIDKRDRAPPVPEIGDKQPIDKREKLEILLKPSRNNDENPSWKVYNLIPLSKENRPFFSGYKIPFKIKSDIGEIDAHPTAAIAGTPKGTPNAGSYLKGIGLTKWFRKHPELKANDIIIFETLDPHKKYKMSVKYA